MSLFARPLEWDHPKPVWIALLILTFLISWPLFLLLLAMLFFTGRLEGWKRAGLALWQEKIEPMLNPGTWWQPHVEREQCLRRISI